MKSSKKILICVICVALVVAIGLTVYFVLANRKKDLTITSYDGEYEYVIGRAHPTAYRTEPFYNIVTIGTRDTEAFFEENVLNSENYVGEYSFSITGEAFEFETIYVLLSQGYYFAVYKSSGDTSIIYVENMTCDISVGSNTDNSLLALFQFPVYTHSFINVTEEDYVVPWENTICSSYDDLVSFYEKTSSDKYQLATDEEGQNIICLNGINEYNLRDYTTDYPIVLICTDEGIHVTTR